MSSEKFKIAIFDNHVYTVTSISTFLENEGFKTVWAYHIKDAIEVCKKENPDLIILDVKLGDENGFKLMKSHVCKHKVIFLISNSKDENKALSFKNCLATIEKPVDEQVLIGLVKDALNIKK